MKISEIINQTMSKRSQFGISCEKRVFNLNMSVFRGISRVSLKIIPNHNLKPDKYGKKTI